MTLLSCYLLNGADSVMYYKGGTSFSYYFFKDLSTTVSILFSDGIELSQSGNTYYFSGAYYLAMRDASLLLMKIVGIIGLFCSKSFISISLIFSLFGFIGAWNIYRIFVGYFPALYFKLFFPLLLIPSVLLFSSGILKEPLVMGCMGILLKQLHNVFILKKVRIYSFVIIILSSYIMIVIKAYIFLTCIVAFFFWYIHSKFKTIRSRSLKTAAFPIITIAGLIIGSLLFLQITSLPKFSEYSLATASKNVVEYANLYKKFDELGLATADAYFSIGAIEPTPIGIVKKIPVATLSAIFRPFPWESNSFLSLFTSFESLIFLLMTLLTLIKTKVYKLIPLIYKNPVLTFSLSFALLMFFVVGISTGNFGTMVRYRIPALPLFLASLIILIHLVKRQKMENKLEGQ